MSDQNIKTYLNQADHQRDASMGYLSQMIRKFNRFELKYLITLKQAQKFKADLKAYSIADENGNENGYYQIASLYYDSPDYRCFWEKMDGIKFRRKLRIRHYQDGKALAADTPVFLEIKQRYDRVTQKRRTVLPYAQALELCNERRIPESKLAADRTFFQEAYTFLWQYNLRPASIVQYRRQALIGAQYDLGLRITFDTLLTCHRGESCLHEVQPCTSMFPEEWVVMEIKVNERIPYWLTEMVAHHNLQLTRVSKYCRSIEVLNGWQPIRVPALETII